ncbi:hypothetical protein ACQWKR_23670, partial [Salmonella enterica subsp. enterica serovar Infantis]
WGTVFVGKQFLCAKTALFWAKYKRGYGFPPTLGLSPHFLRGWFFVSFALIGFVVGGAAWMRLFTVFPDFGLLFLVYVGLPKVLFTTLA